MENSENFSILVENEEQFNRVWAYVRYYIPTTKEITYQEFKPVGVILNMSKFYASFFYSKGVDFKEGVSSISWEQFLEYEKEITFKVLKDGEFASAPKTQYYDKISNPKKIETPKDVANMFLYQQQLLDSKIGRKTFEEMFKEKTYS